MSIEKAKGRVLLIDRDPAASRLATAYLVSGGYEVLAAAGAQEALDRARVEMPDLILLDEVTLASELCHQLRAIAMADRIPILLSVAPGFAVETGVPGTGDLVAKPFDRAELLVKVASLLRLRALHDQLSERIVELTSANARLRKQTITDELTGLYNRRYLEEFTERELSRCGESGAELSLLVLSILRFKEFNHTRGHEAGNLLLRQVAGLMIEPARDSDLAARYRDSGFALVLPQSGRAEATRLVDGLMGRCGQLPVAVALGFASFPDDATDPQGLVRAAERRLDRRSGLGRYLGGTGRAPQASRGSRGEAPEPRPTETGRLARPR